MSEQDSQDLIDLLSDLRGAERALREGRLIDCDRKIRSALAAAQKLLSKQ